MLETVIFTIVIIVIAGGVGLFYTNKIASLSTELSDVKEKNAREQAQQRAQINSLSEKVTSLKKYEAIEDAETKASQIIAEANQSIATLMEKARNEAFSVKEAADTQMKLAQTTSDELKNEASRKAKELKDKAESILNSATQESAVIINNAQKRAKEIAGSAYDAMQRADELQRTAQAMQNVIEGYGDRYLIPVYSLLDELADEFSYTDAGNELKKARERTRLMIKNRTAANCDYAEVLRKTTAIDFVLDAFNGKVDSIISDIKYDNYGTMAQMVRDAAQLVNNNGKAFRNARVLDEYLQARLEELRWAIIVLELKRKSQEEQRLIKEQIREEEKARREYERAIKEAQKDEDTLKLAIEKVRLEVSHATEAQKVKYEAKLQELSEKLKAAEEKNQRALSMAQQTRSGHIYVISNIGSFGENVYKIGMTRRLEPLDRIKELGDSSVPFAFDVHAMIFSDDAPSFEREMHKCFLRNQMNKVNPRKEFFRVTLKEIHKEIESLGIKASWTMTAMATEYRESLAIEKGLANKSLNEDEWVKHQMETLPAELTVVSKI